tara:strand:- start:509 stop:1381 length:873 start_codon:yes stop_codon:yes gene_type:complete
MRYFVFCFFYYLSAVYCQSIYISSEIDTSIAKIGDVITWKIVAHNTNQENIVFPKLNIEDDSISLRSQKTLFTNQDKEGKIIEIAFWDTGRFYTPEYQIYILNKEGGIRSTLEVEKLAIDIISAIEPSMDKVPRPIKGPVSVVGVIPFKNIFLLLLGSIILIGIIWVWNKRIKNIYPASKNSFKKTPIEIARNRLLVLNDKGFSKEFYTELSHITREFVEYSTYIRTLEMTTDEIIQNKELFLFNKDSFNDWTTLLSKADMVKYARESVHHNEMIADKAMVLEFIDEISK